MVGNRVDRTVIDDLGSAPETRGSELMISIASRRAGFDRLRSGILGPSQSAFLLTGEGGSGKTWLWNRLVRSLPASWRGLSVDMTSGLKASEFLHLVGEQLGIEATRSVSSARIQVSSALRDEATDGRFWLLIVEDAHTATPEVWEEIRVLANHLGEVGGFASLLVVAQTELVRRLRGRGLVSIAGKFSDHVHLPSLDVDECRALVEESLPEGQPRIHPKSLEEIHRDARGNSREILRLLRRFAPAPKNMGRRETNPAENEPATPHVETAQPARRKRRIDSPAPVAPQAETQAPVGLKHRVEVGSSSRPRPMLQEVPLVPSRPPLRLEEGLIEVGWNGEEPEQSPAMQEFTPIPRPLVSKGMSVESEGLESPSSEDTVGGDSDLEEAVRAVPTPGPSEEWIEDPYATLQAWSEWARNRELVAEAKGGAVVSSTGRPDDSFQPSSNETVDSGEDDPTFGGVGSMIRAESQHEFAPYGQLFGETRRSKQS